MEDRYDAVWFYYNPSGSAMSFKYHDTRYYYIKNAQDDVTAIVDPNGNIVAKYEYDSWGKVLAVTDADGNVKTSSSHIGNINPLRYRSYFFDTESESTILTADITIPIPEDLLIVMVMCLPEQDLSAIICLRIVKIILLIIQMLRAQHQKESSL